MFTLNDLFDIAAKMEENGRVTYLNALDSVKSKAAAELLEWMADEEDRHRRWFLQQKKNLSASDGDLTVQLPGVLKEMMGENSLSLNDVDFSTVSTPVQMLRIFLMFEKDTILFYQFLEAFVESETVKQGLNRIVREEMAHVDKISDMIQSVEPDQA